jgi:hypothetical protein
MKWSRLLPGSLVFLLVLALSGNAWAGKFDTIAKLAGKAGDIASIVNSGKTVAATGYDLATGSNSDICWKASYGRGVGTVPQKCAPGKDMIGLLCYDQCPAGTKRFGFDCHSTCPDGMRDDGLFCRAAEYGRGAGYAWQIGDHAIAWENQWWAGMTARCERDHGKGNCERGVGIVYPKCKAGYTAFGANICRPNQPDCRALGMNPGVDLSCAKKVTLGAPVVGICAPGQQSQGGLCYSACKPGYGGEGPVCWGACGGKYPVECGAGCATDAVACATSITEQVVGVLSVAATIASTVGTVGAGTAAAQALKAGLKSGTEEMIKQTTKKISKVVLKETVKILAKDAGKSLAIGQVDNLANLLTGEEFDPTTLDPTGIASMVKSFVKPVCDPPGAQSQASMTWHAMPSQANDLGIGGTGEGELWRIGTTRVGGGFDISHWNGTQWSNVPGGAVRIDVDPKGNAWVVNDSQSIFQWSGNGWIPLDGRATDIGIGANGSVWVVGITPVQGGFEIFRRNGNAWDRVPGGAVRIDVDPRGNAWVVNNSGSVFRWTGSTWAGVPGLARDIGIGADGSVFIVGADKSVQKWNGSSWTRRDGGLSEISVSPQGIPFGNNDSKAIWMGYQ